MVAAKPDALVLCSNATWWDPTAPGVPPLFYFSAGGKRVGTTVISVTEVNAKDDFDRAVNRICGKVIESVKEKSTAIDSLINAESDPIYIKSADGTILLSNHAYDEIFAGNMSPVGRLGASFLADTIRPVSCHSDAMIIDGCTSVQFLHIGHDDDGRALRLLSHKQSLLGLGHPTLAILGITRLVEVLSDGQRKPKRSLRELWSQFNELDELDRNISIGLARGKNVATIAFENGVTKKTIENHRTAILRALEFDSPIDVIKLMVRLQENGFGDFGV